VGTLVRRCCRGSYPACDFVRVRLPLVARLAALPDLWRRLAELEKLCQAVAKTQFAPAFAGYSSNQTVGGPIRPQACWAGLAAACCMQAAQATGGLWHINILLAG
jgi:hypothetical protein